MRDLGGFLVALQDTKGTGHADVVKRFGETHPAVQVDVVCSPSGELMQRLDLKRGQQLHVVELAGGGFQALPFDPDFEQTMDVADDIMDEYRDTLTALAK